MYIMPHPRFVSEGSDNGQFLIQDNSIYLNWDRHIWAQFLSHPYDALSLPDIKPCQRAEETIYIQVDAMTMWGVLWLMLG